MSRDVELVREIARLLHEYVDRYPYIANLQEGDAIVREVGVVVELASDGEELTLVIGEIGVCKTTRLYDPPPKRGTPEEILRRAVGHYPTSPSLTDDQRRKAATFGRLVANLAAELGEPQADKAGAATVPWKVSVTSGRSMPRALMWFGSYVDGKLVPDPDDPRPYELQRHRILKASSEP